MMYLDFFNFGGYGIFIWTAFIFTFASCFFLYIKIKIEFTKHEKMFVKNFKTTQTRKIKYLEKKEVLIGSSIL